MGNSNENKSTGVSFNSAPLFKIPLTPFIVEVQPLEEGNKPVRTRIAADYVEGSSIFVGGYVVYRNETSNEKAGYLQPYELEHLLETKQYTIVQS